MRNDIPLAGARAIFASPRIHIIHLSKNMAGNMVVLVLSDQTHRRAIFIGLHFATARVRSGISRDNQQPVYINIRVAATLCEAIRESQNTTE